MYANYDDVLAQIQNHGLILTGGIEVGTSRPKRVFVENDSREKRGWYWLNDVQIEGQPYIVGAYGIYHGNDSGKQTIQLTRSGQPVQIDPELRKAIRAQQAEQEKRMKAMRAAEAESAAQEAARVWRSYRPGINMQSDYLQRKGVGAHGVRWAPSENGSFAIAMADTTGKIWGIQIICGQNRKKGELEKEFYPPGLAKKGHFHTLGVIRDTVLITEGYATGATLYECTGLPVVVAFDAGNLLPVAEAIHKAHRGARIVICADDDYLTDGNPGVTKAQAAAVAVSGQWVKPMFQADRAGKKLTDFNDLCAIEGSEAVRTIIQGATNKTQQNAALSLPVRGSPAEGEGDCGVMPSRISIDDASRRFWGTYGLGGDVLFDEVERRLVCKKDVINLLPRHGWDALRDHPDWRVARDTEIGFDPTEKDKGIRCNLFGGWPTEPKQGECATLLGLLEYLCHNEQNSDDVYQWILKWLAYPIQHRGAKMHSAIVVHGLQGTGKNRFFEAYAAIFGVYGRVLGQEAIEDKFNSDWAEKKLFILADEVLARQDMYHIKNRLKGFITGGTIRVNPKGVAAHNEKNQMNIVFLSNERMPIVLENGDRRHCVIWTPPAMDDEYFEAVNREIEAGGIAALHHYLLHLDLGDFKPWTKPPMTRAKQELIELSSSSEERFIEEWMAGELENREGETLPFCPCLGSDLYLVYERWCDTRGERKRGQKDLISLASKKYGWKAGEPIGTYLDLNNRKQKLRRMVVPAAVDLEKAGTPQRISREKFASTQEWLTACYFEFSEKVQK